MAVSQIPSSNDVVITLGSSGTYNLDNPLVPGLYLIETDTTQSLSGGQFYFTNSDAFRFNVTLRGGLSYISIPQTATQIVLTTGTFPIFIKLTLISSYDILPAPIVASANWSWNVNNTFNLIVSPPVSASSVGIFWNNGAFTDLGTAASFITNISPNPTASIGSQYITLISAKDANGAWGVGTKITSPRNPFIVYTTSGNYVTPSWSTAADVLLVAGGGGGGGGQFSSGNTAAPLGGAGGGGAGGVRFIPSLTTTGTISVIVGAGGAAGGYSNNTGGVIVSTNGGTTSFGINTASGGGSGTGWGGNAIAYGPGSGGSGGGYAGNNTGSGGSGISGQGFAGGSGAAGTSRAGGGGGQNNAGLSGTASGTGGTGSAYYVNYIVGYGGSGGISNGTGAGAGGASGAGNHGFGGGGGFMSGNLNGQGAAGGSGVVIVKAL